MNAFVFDVDGVIANPIEKKITHPEIATKISSIIEKENIVAFLTGRALPWVKERVITPIEKELSEKKLLDNIYVSGEFGYTTLEFNNAQKIENSQDSLITERLVKDVRALLAPYSSSIFFDLDKKSMISLEVKKGYPLEKFHKQQKVLLDKLKKLIQNPKLEITHNIIAIDIKEKAANKHLAVEKMLKWLESRGKKPDNFYAFGDNTSDLEIARELSEHNFQVEFIFTGDDKEKIEGEDFPVVKTKEKFDSGTLEFLNSLNI